MTDVTAILDPANWDMPLAARPADFAALTTAELQAAHAARVSAWGQTALGA